MIFRVFFVLVGLGLIGGATYLGAQGIGGESQDVPGRGSVRIGSSGGYYAGGSVK
ncbi:hypothetical protein [Tropicibacter naphthalenivorans]|uniref:Uncharacterized protein n=1 Tax=Tropicibacter naphthalenivorans TaxID=441103 RepID=A0A0P1GKG0_9RHOB|nr:hypothetical protein [Tropicibacter naphthalenivorans]CUH82504.1 hypothetical protein TRN7648_04046 [Tropicibacter naphthalenivorans]SMD06920.1 hypothetical protein SAMN04488093_11514 [Tropicibacter naphthalenivorans]